ncbi:MAG: shikimate dehydrogenase [Bacteroidota bacterium]|nr:shikimate dehydrogenase [Bacteroidota bacterium]
MKIFGLIGYPLEHSYSKKYFTRKFSKEEINNVIYNEFPIKDIRELRSLVNQYPELQGLNVTIPFKEKVIPYLDKIDHVAKIIGSVNTIQIDRTNNKPQLTGYNTDFFGFEKSLLQLIKKEKPQKTLIFGSGGSSKTAQFILNKFEIEFQIVSRKAGDNQLSYEDVDKEIIDSHKLIINTTPLGMYPNISSFPKIAYEYLTNSHFLFDFIYNPSETTFLKKGKEKGAKVQNGLKMLYLQAEKSWEIWNKDEE